MSATLRFLIAATSLVLGTCASGIPCPNSPGFRLSDEAREKCEENFKESIDECRNLVADLQRVKNPSAQQRFDLATGWSAIGWREEELEKGKQLRLRSKQEFRKLHKEFPEDVQIMIDLLIGEDDETRLDLHRKVSHLAPDCALNNQFFVEKLDQLTDYGWDRPDQDPRLVNELVSLIDQGYEHAEKRWSKMFFGHLKYRELLLQDKHDSASHFRNQIVTELDPGNFPFQDDPTSHGWGLLCGSMGYKLRFAEICLNTIERTLNGELRHENETIEYGYSGVHILSRELNTNRRGVLYPSPPDTHIPSNTLYTASEGARILMRLRDIMDSVPENKRSTAYHSAYTKVVGKRPEVEFPDADEIFNLIQ